MKMSTKLFSYINLIFALSGSVNAQDLYTLDLSDSSTYSITCGKATKEKWSVRNEYCSLTTSPVQFPGNPAKDSFLIASVTLLFSDTENHHCEDLYPAGVFIRYAINGGAWILQSSETPCKLNQKISFKIHAAAGSRVQIMVSMALNATNSKKISLNDTGIIVGPAIVANTLTWVK